jgi:hypothetical protein
MTEQAAGHVGTRQTDRVAGATTSRGFTPGRLGSVLQVLRDQRKAVVVAAALAVATYWVAGQLGEWRLAACVAAGIALGLVNHLVTEYWLLRVITSGEEPTRNKMISSTLVRLLVLTVVAVGAAAAFWPDGVGLLLGLAIFRLVALMMTALPLLKELKTQ